MALSPSRIGLAAGFGALGACFLPAWAGQTRSTAAGDALQVLADVVLIESECRQINVDYGELFRFAERNGIRPVDIMPLGERRPAFDAAYRQRAQEMRGERLCIDLVAQRETLLPGVFTQR